MRVIITGGTGLIGRALVQELTGAKHEVIVLSRNPESAKGLPKEVQCIRWDGRTSQGWGEWVDGAGAIINLAGESIGGETLIGLILNRWTPERKRRILDSRLNAGNAVIQGIREARQKPQVLIQASAVGYYGSRGETELIETTPPANDFGATTCIGWEKSTAPVEEIGVRRVVIRTAGVVMSLHGGVLPFMLIPFKLFLGGPLGNGRQWFSWIHVKDEARAIRYLIEHPFADGVFNLCAPGIVTNKAFSNILGKVLKRPSIIPVPAFALRLIFGEKADIILGSQKQISTRLSDLGFSFQFPDAESALRDLLPE